MPPFPAGHAQSAAVGSVCSGGRCAAATGWAGTGSLRRQGLRRRSRRRVAARTRHRCRADRGRWANWPAMAGNRMASRGACWWSPHRKKMRGPIPRLACWHWMAGRWPPRRSLAPVPRRWRGLQPQPRSAYRQAGAPGRCGSHGGGRRCDARRCLGDRADRTRSRPGHGAGRARRPGGALPAAALQAARRSSSQQRLPASSRRARARADAGRARGSATPRPCSCWR